MKRIKLSLVVVLAMVGLAAQAQQQIDFNDPRFANWGADAQSREENMLTNTYFSDAFNNKDYVAATPLFLELVEKCPEASEAIFARGVVLYRAKIGRAKDMTEKKLMVDSLMIVHDLRLKYYSNHAKRGKDYILDSKARDYYNFMKSDRAGLREVFRSTIEAGGEATDPQLVLLYFQNLCEDYKMDEVLAEEVISEYDRLSPFFDKLESEYSKLRDDFTTAFSVSGVATCENLESIFSAKMIADPDNTELMDKAVKLMNRLRCNTPFYVATAERLYLVEPSSKAAMALASIFQRAEEYDKASKYLRDAMAAEEDVEERETLSARIALVELAAGRIDAAISAARESINTPDDTKSDNGIAYFVLAQCYASMAGNCSGFDSQTVYWLAYDVMAMAVANFTPEEAEYKTIAQNSMSAYKSYFPSQEECFFNEIRNGDSYSIKCGALTGQKTTVRVRE